MPNTHCTAAAAAVCTKQGSTASAWLFPFENGPFEVLSGCKGGGLFQIYSLNDFFVSNARRLFSVVFSVNFRIVIKNTVSNHLKNRKP